MRELYFSSISESQLREIGPFSIQISVIEPQLMENFSYTESAFSTNTTFILPQATLDQPVGQLIIKKDLNELLVLRG